MAFGADDGAPRLVIDCADGPCALEGRIDRVDVAELPPETSAVGADDAPAGSARFVRVIDYKRGNRAPDPAELFAGLQLQLPVYLGAAMRAEGARSAGAYYFRVDEGLVNTQSGDAQEVEAAREKQLRMSGMLPSGGELLQALAAEPRRVFKGLSTGGAPLPTSISADSAGFERIVGNALARAREHIDGIRAGLAAAAPMRTRKYNPCQWCAWREACLRDESLDARTARELAPMKAAAFAEALKGEQGKGNQVG